MNGMIMEDPLRRSLKYALLFEFATHGYSREEAMQLAEIAVRPIEHALQMAQDAAKLHLEAVALALHAQVKP